MAAVGCSSGESGSSTTASDSAPTVLSGYYSAGSDQPSYNFTDATHYTVTTESACTFTEGVGTTPGTLPDAGAWSNSPTEEPDGGGDYDAGGPPVANDIGNPGSVSCPSSVTDTGTYILTGGTLSLKSDTTGQTASFPFETLSTEPAVTSTSLGTQDVAPLGLVGGDGGALATSGGALVKPAGSFKLVGTSYGRAHSFVVQAKLFIAPIASNAVGSLGGGGFQDFEVTSLAKVTNLTFSENPADGTQASGQFRVWNQFKVDAVCVGTLPTLKVYALGTDAGYEGPLKGNVFGMPVGAGAALTSTGGNFYEVGSGSPNDAASIAFTVIKARPSTVIWQAFKGSVTCNSDGTASSTISTSDIQKPGFPTLRIWTMQHDGPQPLVIDSSSYKSTGAPVQVAQGNFVNLWALTAVPTYGAFTGPYESTATPVTASPVMATMMMTRASDFPLGRFDTRTEEHTLAAER